MSVYEPSSAAVAAREPLPAPSFDDAALASIGRRFLALVIDWFVLMVLIVVTTVAVIAITGLEEEPAASVLTAGSAVLIALLYAPLLLCRRGARNGQTLGKQLLKVRVVTKDGGPVGFWRGCRREVLGVLVPQTVTFGFYALADCPWALVDSRKQALHDKIGATYVVRADAAPVDRPSPSRPPAAPLPPEAPRQLWERPSSADPFDEARRAFGR